MELMSNEKQEKENNSRKIVIICLIATIALILLIGGAILVLQLVENNKLKLKVDGKKETISDEFIVVDSETQTIYYNIRQVANFVNYNFFNGEYKQYSEDRTKCYVECKDELAMLELNSNVIYKNNAADKLNIDKYITNGNVKIYNNALYATSNIIQISFNVRLNYIENTKTIIIETLPYLVDYYREVATNYGYTGIAEDFITQKTIAKNLLVVKKDEKYGVVNTKDFSEVIGTKYDKLVYIENTNEFIATNEKMTGTLSTNGETNIDLRYQEVGLIDGQARLYYVKNNNLFGVLNQNGRVIVYSEYENIGIDRNIFPLDDIKNNLFLYENCIPLKKDGKWGMADKNGDIILNFEYDQLGYAEISNTSLGNGNNQTNVTSLQPSGDKNTNNVVVIPAIEGIVIGKGNLYGIANSIGRIVIPCEFNKIYSVTNEGEEEYYLEKDGRVTELTRYLEENKINANIPGRVDITNNNPTNTFTNQMTNQTNSNTTNQINNNANHENTNIDNELVFIM